MSEMNALDIARRIAALNRPEDACRAYTLALAQERPPEETLEAALYILQTGGDYKVSYTALRGLYDRGCFRQEVLAVMTQAFYEPNVKLLKSRYEKNCKLLQKYPYLFRRDFPAFEALPLRFYPYDDNGYLPFDIEKEQFGDYVNFNHPVVSRNFFHDLENPILATDVFSQYELEYLNDNVRKSEWVARENHIYLHYTDWAAFCAHLQVLNLRPLLADKKIVFLIGDEVAQYPIDFKARFGIDYSGYTVKPFRVQEFKRLIWHTQLAAHNGGDFFNEIFDNHPNLVTLPSSIFSEVQEKVEKLRKSYREPVVTIDNVKQDHSEPDKAQRIVAELRRLKAPTEKDFFVALFLFSADLGALDRAGRIVPGILFQPHFHNVLYNLSSDPKGVAVLDSKEYQKIQQSPILRGFKYIKTFTPMRRLTTSAAATVRFMCSGIEEAIEEKNDYQAIADILMQRVCNRSYMIDWQDRLFKDSVLVRFEDGKLNPKATFTALAAFLDIPYTQSMTYCSLFGKRDPESLKGNDRGFSPAAVYRTYDEYLGAPERCYLEFCLRDVYEYYGYNFQYYDGAPVDLARVQEWVSGMKVFDRHVCTTLYAAVLHQLEKKGEFASQSAEERGETARGIVERQISAQHSDRMQIAALLLRGLRFVNKNGQPLRMMPRLQLDPALLEQPLYH
ncbi:MAG: hypothetical protein SO044_04085 [Agathobaculum sp.]|uniref:hypothetical protein n=1 Tax=Agathobaculum sp. TaxID=2048138 RepID=UPI002A823D46|nr:hypothetical protein [Agathobaculum sp.]MDY3711579.1 hypothetical protein [Agathobaculum sp.]